jgi:hypothetical protein
MKNYNGTRQHNSNGMRQFINALRNNGNQWHTEANGTYRAQTDTLYKVMVEDLQERGELNKYKPRQLWNAANNHNAFPTGYDDQIIVEDDAAAIIESL